MTAEARAQFADAIRAAGLVLPEKIEADGELHRFAANDKRADRAGWYVFHGDGIPAGMFGDWRTGLMQPWRADVGRALTQGEEAAHRAKVQAMRRQREAEEKTRHAAAAKKAAAIWQGAKPAPADHAYLIRKAIQPNGARMHKGALTIPMRAGGKLHSLQFIGADGSKKFLTGGRVSGCYYGIGKPDGVLCITEGYATGASVHEATGHAVAVSFNWGNMGPVALALRAKFPDLRLILCADDDAETAGNPGLTAARAAAQSVGGVVAIPDFGTDRPAGVSDFNDMRRQCSAEAVAGAIAGASASAVPEHQPPAGNATGGDADVAPIDPQPKPTEARSNKNQAAPLNWAELQARGEPPPRRWALRGWFGFGHVSLLVGPGGIGKTLIAQQAGSCLALGRPDFIDEIPAPLPTLMWCCEDDADELWRRQINIARWQGVQLDEFSGSLILEPRAGLDNALVVSEFGRLIFTPLLEELREQAGDYRADVVILDNVAQMFGASENDRHAVTMFLNALVGALPGRAILLLAHPSRGTGSEFSGSSAWENCCRTRLYLGDKLPDMTVDETEPADGVRFLARRKANYSTRDYRRLTFSDGVLIPDPVEAGGGIVDHLRREKAVRVVVAAVDRLHGLGVRTTDGSTSPHFLPKQVLEYKLGEGCTKRELADAMRRAVLDGKLTRGTVGKYANRAPMYGLMVAG